MKNIKVVDDRRIDFEADNNEYALTIISPDSILVEHKEDGFLVSDEKADIIEHQIKNLGMKNEYEKSEAGVYVAMLATTSIANALIALGYSKEDRDKIFNKASDESIKFAKKTQEQLIKEFDRLKKI